MTSKNDITGDNLQSKATTNAYRDNWDRIFGCKNKGIDIKTDSNGTPYYNFKDEKTAEYLLGKKKKTTTEDIHEAIDRAEEEEKTTEEEIHDVIDRAEKDNPLSPYWTQEEIDEAAKKAEEFDKFFNGTFDPESEILLDEESWEKFQKTLERPAQVNQKLKDLLKENEHKPVVESSLKIGGS